VLGDRPDHVAEHRQVGADDQPPAGIEQGGIEVFLLANERRHGRALDHGLHLALDGAQRAAHQLQRDGVAAGLCWGCRNVRHLPHPISAAGSRS
jgi:hypothetical protein